MAKKAIYPARGENRKRVLLLLRWYSHAIHRGVARFAGQVGWVLDAQAARYGKIPAGWDGDGIITMLSTEDAFADFVRGSSAKIVNLSWRDCPMDLPMVLHDDESIGRMGAEHFIHRGYCDLAFYRAEPLAVAADRMKSFAAEAARVGRRFHSLDIAADFPSATDEQRQRWLIDKIKSLPRPLAVMAQNDDRAAEFLNAAEACGLAVPEQVAILGCDNESLDCEFASVSISSIDTDLEGVGYAGAELLDGLMRGWAMPRQPRLIPPKQLVERRSTDMQAVRDPNVAAALGFIAEHFSQPIGVADVVAAVATSRRSLYNAFEKCLSRSIGKEITRRRLEHACRQLEQDGRKLSSVAIASGFTSLEVMCKTFRRELGKTPSEYRTVIS